MSMGRQTVRDLVEEAKKRVVLLFVCVFGLSYLMSLTSSSVWVNLPAAASLIIFFRYLSLDLDVRRRASSSNRAAPLNKSSRERSIELPKIPVDKLSWRRKVNSPVVEAAIDQFIRHLVSEWVTDLWYSRITPDKDGPEELVQVMNDVLGEVSCRARDINLINLLTRDIIDLFCSHLELYRCSQAKIGKEELGKLSIDHRDAKLRLVLAAENKLHPALVSVEAEHKVLQHLMSGLISLIFKPKDLQCSFFQFTVRELLACAVVRPILNMVNPRFINEKIELLAISMNKKTIGVTPTEDVSRSKPNGSSRISGDQLSGSLDNSNAGVELVQLKHDSSITSSDEMLKKNSNQLFLLKDSNNPGANLHTESVNADERNAGPPLSGGEWGHMLDVISTRKTRALAPEHFENMWTKGRNYKKKEGGNYMAKQVGQSAAPQAAGTLGHSKVTSKYLGNVHLSQHQDQGSAAASCVQANGKHNTHPPDSLFQEKVAHHLNQGDAGVDSESSYETDDDDSNYVTGLDSPGIRVWDSKNKRNPAVSRIRHPLESLEASSTKRNEGNTKNVDLSDESETESWGRVYSGSAASSSMSIFSSSEDCRSSLKPSQNFVLEDSFLKLRCEVLGANIVKCCLGTFAVYSISVTDAANYSWSIKRRFRHFEELHRRLKEFPEYNLSLPPKHFLSSGLEVPVVQERFKLLDKYLKMLLQLPTVSGSIEVWDFLSVDSQTYIFSDSFSIIQTLSVNLDDKSSEKGGKLQRTEETVNGHLYPRGDHLRPISEGSTLPINNNSEPSLFKKTNVEIHLANNSRTPENQLAGNSGSDSEIRLEQNISSVKHGKPVKVPIQGVNGQQGTSLSMLETVTDPTIPIEWVPPNLSTPILDLVDVVFQLRDGGWIRRQIFWIAKQVLQLGMGDAFDDWLIEKIQLLRSGSVIAHAIKRVEQILWPDGIFITKHPSRRRPTPLPSPAGNQKDNRTENLLTNEQQLEAARRAQFVYELIIDKAPAALVGLIGRKEYERCAEDIYFFLQSSVCLKQLAFELLELLLLTAFPELDDVVGHFHEEKEHFSVAKGK
uniref:Sorting nexin-13 n=1 Tax=Anthurium amnicola TaxID=1678845 RepID=A0A1D1XC65_9ARAE